MAFEYTASIENFVSTVVVNNWRGTGRTARMNTADYLPERDGELVEGPTVPPNTPGVADPPLKDPRLDDHGRVIADLASPMHRA